jgi:uncharacterized protein YdbL (DUF1318 family)
MRKFSYLIMTVAAVALVGCVTINVYFPEAAAQKAADQFIGNVLDDAAPPAKAEPATPPPSGAVEHPRPSAMLLNLLVPSAYAADVPDLRVQTTATEAIRARMKTRFHGLLGALLASGAVGFTHDGLVAMHDAGKIPLNQRAQANAAVASENRDRLALYQEIASANNHPEWAGQIRTTFARGWIERAHSGWYYQDAAGKWKRK